MLEVESKFQMTSPQVFDWIRSQKQVAGYELSDQEMIPQRDTYLDTAAGTLFHHGASLRLRKKKGTDFVTFKTQIEGVEVRAELEMPLTALQVQDLLLGNLTKIRGEAVRAAMTYLKGEGVYPVLHVENPREAWYVRRDAEIVKICFDAVRYTNVDGSQCVEEYELELELKQGKERFLQEIAQGLSQRYGLIPTLQSKYERGVALLNVFTPAR